MAWTSIPIFTDAVLTSSQANLLRGNLNETAPALATLPGQHFAATGVNTIEARRLEKATTNQVATTTSVSYTATLSISGGGTSPGPSLTVITGQYAQVGMYSYLHNSGTNDFTMMSFVVSGANDTAASDTRASASIDYTRLSSVHWLVAQTPGSHDYDASYRVEAGTGTYDDRTMWVLPY